MNRELQQVRRYWPKATVRDRPPAFPYYAICANGWSDKWIKLLPDCGMACVVDGRNWYRCDWRATIAEAMRAAGFGPRPWGEYASRLKRARTVLRRRGSYVTIVTLDWPPQLADRQRPRKGARLGRRKREALRRIEALGAKP